MADKSLSVSQLLVCAARADALPLMARLVRHYGANPREQSPQSDIIWGHVSALHAAADAGALRAARYLVCVCGVPVDMVSNYSTPLRRARSYNHAALCRQLIAWGANSFLSMQPVVAPGNN